MPLVLGISASLATVLPGPLLALALLAAACLACRSREGARILLPASLALAAGFCSARFHDTQPVVHSAHTQRIACTVLDVTRTEIPERSTCEARNGAVYAIVADESLTTGTNVLLRGRIEAFDGPRNPGEPDLTAIERERGVAAQIAPAHIIARLPPQPPSMRVRIALAQSWALQQFRARMPEPYASIVAGELWGERAALPPDLRAEFQETGTVHILVTAGLHVGVVTLVVMSLLRAARAPRFVVAAVAFCAIWAYAAFSGLHLPSVRASVMASFGLAAYACGAAPLSWSAYGAALLALALFVPGDLHGASFALSFSCVGAILLLGDTISHCLDCIALPERVREALVLTIATQIGTWPLTAATFLIFAPYAIVANFLVVPVVGATMIAGAGSLLLAPLDNAAQLAANVSAWLLAWIVACVRAISSTPGAVIPMTPPPVWAIACYDASLVAAVALWSRGARTPALCLPLFAVLAIVFPAPDLDRTLKITVLDVGQADAIVIRTPLHHTILVDAGGKLERGASLGQSTAEDVGTRIVVPFLRRSGVGAIDAIILSHPHGDHAGGVAPVLRSFGVLELADSGQHYGGYAYNDAIQTAKGKHVPIVYPRAGATWRTDDGVTLTFIGPSLPFIESGNTINDNSIAFVLQYKQFRMLFTGDAGVAAEQRFLNEGVDLRADVLKVGHHGSAYSSSPAFIAAVHPKYAIISVGRHNMFGHPAPSTIETLERYGARVYRTDSDGAATIRSDGFRESLTSLLDSRTPRPTRVRLPRAFDRQRY